MGNFFSQRQEEVKKFYKDLTEKERNKILCSFVKLNGVRIKLEDAGLHHVNRDELLKSLNPNQINEILQGQEITLKFKDTKPVKLEEKQINKDDTKKEECSSSSRIMDNFSTKKKKEVKKFYKDLTEEEQNKLLSSVVILNENRTELRDAEFYDVELNELLNNLTPEQIYKILQGQEISFNFMETKQSLVKEEKNTKKGKEETFFASINPCIEKSVQYKLNRNMCGSISKRVIKFENLKKKIKKRF